MQPIKGNKGSKKNKKRDKNKKKSSKKKERLYSDDLSRRENKRRKDKKSKNKNKRFYTNTWNTIVLATSPTEKDSTMLFEEGPKYGGNDENYMGKQQRSGTGSIAINIVAKNTQNGNKNGKGNKKNSDAKSPRSPSSKKIGFPKFNFLKNDNKSKDKGGDKQNGDASSPRASNQP